MLYDIGLFCIILTIVIGLTTMVFQLPKKRSLGLIAALMIASFVLIGISINMPVTPMAKQQEMPHE